jgi:hypothetical protein
MLRVPQHKAKWTRHPVSISLDSLLSLQHVPTAGSAVSPHDVTKLSRCALLVLYTHFVVERVTFAVSRHNSLQE